MMTIRCYADPSSGSCQRVSAVIQHFNIEVDIEEIFIDLFAGDTGARGF